VIPIVHSDIENRNGGAENTVEDGINNESLFIQFISAN